MALLLLLGCGSESPRPSLVLITLDTTRADRLGAYGYGPISPELDALAQRGAKFTQAIAQAAVTPVSHASILTGLNPYSHGLRVLHGVRENRLGEAVPTLAEVLSEVGYRTGAFVSAFPVAERFGLDQGFETFDADFLRAPESRIVTQEGIVNTGANQRGARETTDRALAWLAEVPSPFLLWVHYFDPHDPDVRPPNAYLARRRDDWRSLRGAREVWNALYDVEISYMDAHIGRLLEALERRSGGVYVVVVADHGEGLGDHDWWTHGVLYQEQIRVPLLLAGPTVPPGLEVEHVVRTIDIMPTLLEWARVAATDAPPMEGESLVPLLQPGAPDPGHVAYSDSVNMLTYRVHPQITDEKDDMLFAVVDWPWKYIHHWLRPEESELYRLDRDPRELENRLREEPEVAARLLELLRSRDFEPEEPASVEGMSGEDLERLRALGYVE